MESSGGQLMELRWGIYFVIKLFIKVKCRLKAAFPRGISFYVTACLGEAGTSLLTIRLGSAGDVGPQGLHRGRGPHEAAV